MSNLAFLSTAVVDAILDGRTSAMLTAKEAIPSLWYAQAQSFSTDGRPPKAGEDTLPVVTVCVC